MEIIYPQCHVAKQSLNIGVTAPSSGVGRDSVFHKRLNAVVEYFRTQGHQLHLGACLIDDVKHVSGSAEDRATEFLEMWFDPSIDLIYPPWGGKFLMNILPHIDFTVLQARPTWVQGFSDISTLLLAITTCTGIATAHGTNLMDSIEGQDELTRQSRDYLTCLPGERWQQRSSAFWQAEWADYAENIRALYQLTEPTYWRCLNPQGSEGQVTFSGRLIGGCLDVICRLAGTPYGNVPRFSRDYCAEEGTIFYAENCEMNSEEVYRALYQLKLAGWFSHIKGIVLGRNGASEEVAASGESQAISYDEAVKDALGDLAVPIIVDADIGHMPPQMTLINGSVGEFSVDNGRATLTQALI